MKTIPAAHIGMTQKQSEAIAAFELAHAESRLSAIGHGLRYQRRAALAAAFAAIEKLDLYSALTPEELADARFACKFIS